MSDVYAVPQVVEDHEMGKVKEIFDRALNAMVNASTLAKDVDQLKTDLDALKVTVTHYRNTIANQDDQITRLRQERDASRTAQYHAEDAARHQATELETAKRELDSTMGANMRLNERISELAKERDDAQFKLLELQESHASLSKKMDDVKAHMQSLFGLAEPPEPSKPEPDLSWQPPKFEETQPANVTVLPVIPVEPPPEQEPMPQGQAVWPQDIR